MAIVDRKPRIKTLPSRYDFGDEVSLNFFEAGVIRRARIIRIHFTESKVLYDVSICVSKARGDEDEDVYTRLYNIDSVFVTDPIQ